LEPVDAKEQPTSMLPLYTHTSLLLFKFVVHLLNKVVESHLSAKTPSADLAYLPAWESPQTQNKHAACRKPVCEQSDRKVKHTTTEIPILKAAFAQQLMKAITGYS
jgi:hypothetical protein